MEQKRLRVIIADDHAAMRGVVVRLLGDDYDVVASVGDGKDLIAAATSIEADVLIVDISMPGVNGLEALRIIRRTGIDTPAVILTNSADASVVEEALRVASGFVVKDYLAADCVPAIRAVLRGERFVSPRID